MYRKRKAQGALEFLMTYGWAFLVILIMIGALAYFGILNPTRFLPDRCQFGNPLLCKREQFTIRQSDTSTVIAKLTNNFGSSIKLYGAEIITDYATVSCTGVCLNNESSPTSTVTGGCTADDILLNSSTPPAWFWEEGRSFDLKIDCNNGNALSTGDKVKFIIKLKWFPTASSETFKKDTQGEIYANAQQS
jgi:hypothetical protein